MKYLIIYYGTEILQQTQIFYKNLFPTYYMIIYDLTEFKVNTIWLTMGWEYRRFIATNSNFLIPILIQFDNAESTFWNIKGLDHFVSKIKVWEN